MTEHSRCWRDFLLPLACWGAALLVTLIFLALVGDLAWQGASALSLDFLFAEVRDVGRAGGIGPILISTGLVLLVALSTCLPLGIGTALYLSEVAPRRSLAARALRLGLEVLGGVPGIVFGLFGAAFFCGFLGLGFSLLSGGLTLTCMVLPLLIRTTEEGLRAVPQEYREGAAALGLSRVTTWRTLILPAAAPSILAGVLLSQARMLAGAAALLFTSGYVTRTPGSLFDPGRVLAIHIYDLSMNVPGGDRHAFASALVLLSILFLLNLLAHFLTHSWRKRHIQS
jgi:phosphate transport system permease protein